MPIITVKYPSACRACNQPISTGEQANYINSRLFHTGCKTTGAYTPRRKPAGYYASKRDPRGLYTVAGRMIGRVQCEHEDYPCCGC